MQTSEHINREADIDEQNEKNIFILGILVLFAWMLVIILCASPQLFRDFIQNHFCCCWRKTRKNDESIREAQERMLLANKSFLKSTLTENPSKILVSQVMLGPRHSGIHIPEVIPEESRCTSLQPTNRSLSISSSTTTNTNACLPGTKSRAQSVSIMKSPSSKPTGVHSNDPIR